MLRTLPYFPHPAILCAAAIAATAAWPCRAGAADPLPVAEPHTYCSAPDAASGSGQKMSLAELVAVGMRQNADTRVAWAQAEEAALHLGVVRSKYGPILAAQAAALHAHSAFPLPKTLRPSGYFKSDAEGAIPAVTLKWSLYDGGRQAALDHAGQQLAGADFNFSATHRRIALQVTQQFFRLAAQAERQAAAQDSLQSAQLVEQLAQARQLRGLATAPEALQASAQAAQARLDMEAAVASAQDTYMALLEAAGMRPDMNACIALPGADAAAPAAARNLARLVESAIAARPEVGAAMARVRAGEASVQQARAAYGPKVTLAASVGENLGRSRSDGGAWSSVNQPVYSLAMMLEFPLYDGQIRNNELRSAQSRQESAEAQLDGVRNKVVHEVVKAYRDQQVAERRRGASTALLAAAARAFDATLAAYRQGLATMPELQSALAALSRARSTDAEASADAVLARAVLLFASGDLMDVK